MRRGKEGRKKGQREPVTRQASQAKHTGVSENDQETTTTRASHSAAHGSRSFTDDQQAAAAVSGVCCPVSSRPVLLLLVRSRFPADDESDGETPSVFVSLRTRRCRDSSQPQLLPPAAFHCRPLSLSTASQQQGHDGSSRRPSRQRARQALDYSLGEPSPHQLASHGSRRRRTQESRRASEPRRRCLFTNAHVPLTHRRRRRVHLSR